MESGEEREEDDDRLKGKRGEKKKKHLVLEIMIVSRNNEVKS